MKVILRVNGYVGTQQWNINDYKKLEPVLKLSNYKVLINFWNNGRGLNYIPFKNWASGRSGNLVWYQNYNKVKHNREEEFHLASLENLIPSICGLFVLLFSQYGVQVFNPYQTVQSYDSLGEVIHEGSSIFSIVPPVWQESEKYDFDWNAIRGQKNPFKKFRSF
ncbi:MAG: hypothetical protein HQ538_00440 [Parcubacteria group bacterium]|nr:hypothetical protein [Parcubacteria group bacterium]